jgi:hypothetical protein
MTIAVFMHPLTAFSGGAAVVPLIRCTKSQLVPSAASNRMQRKGGDVQQL